MASPSSVELDRGIEFELDPQLGELVMGGLEGWYTELGMYGPDRLMLIQERDASIMWAISEVPTVGCALIVAVLWMRSEDRRARQFDRTAERDGGAELEAYNAYLARLRGGDGAPVPHSPSERPTGGPSTRTNAAVKSAYTRPNVTAKVIAGPVTPPSSTALRASASTATATPWMTALFHGAEGMWTSMMPWWHGQPAENLLRAIGPPDARHRAA